VDLMFMGTSTPVPPAMGGSLDDLLGGVPQPQPQTQLPRPNTNILQVPAGQAAPDTLFGLMYGPGSGTAGARTSGAASEVGGLAGLSGGMGGGLGNTGGCGGSGGSAAGMVGGGGGLLSDLGLDLATGAGIAHGGV
jgi:hypothetical protein